MSDGTIRPLIYITGYNTVLKYCALNVNPLYTIEQGLSIKEDRCRYCPLDKTDLYTIN